MWDVTARTKGTIKGGYLKKKFSDGSLQGFSGFVGEGIVDHSFTPRHTIKLRILRQLNEANVQGSNYYVTMGFILQYFQRVTTKITAKADLAYGRDRFYGGSTRTDNTWKAGFVTIITNSLAVAQEMLDAPGVTVVTPGGTLRRDTASLVGTDGLDMLRKYNVQKGFFGAHGINVPEGLTDVSADEADVKRPLVAMCRQVIAVLDATKWGQVGLASFASLEQIDKVITDVHAPCDLVGQVRALGVEVVLV